MATISKRKSGWQAQVRKKGYKPVSKCFDKKSDAEAWARRAESEMDRAVFVDRAPAERTTLGDLIDRYLAEVTPLKKGAAAERYRLLGMRKHSLTLRSLATLTSADFSVYRDERLKRVSGSTVKKELNLFAHMFDVARRDWGLPVENTVRLVRRPKANQSRERRLLPGELEKVIQSSSSETLAWAAELAVETAMRRGEIAQLRWEQISIKDQVLHLPETKNGSSRDVPLSIKACQILRSIPRRLDGWVLGPIDPHTLTKAFERACERAGVVNLRFHDLRHEATSRLFEKGLNPMQVSAITGHRTLDMLKRYTHLKAQGLARALG